MCFTYQQLIKATNARILYQNCDIVGTFRISTDTRNIANGDIYLPLKGETFDGEDFVKKAIENGAEGFFTSSKNPTEKNAKFALYVEDTKIAYLKLANYYKKKVNPITIAITGSTGKTTTKEIAFSIFSEVFKTHKSELNHNNEIGLCQTLLSMPKDTEVLIVEMGMRARGEIELLSKYAEPDIAIITNVGTAHIGILGSKKNIALAKCEIASHLHKEGALISFDDKLIVRNLKFNGKKIFINKKINNFQILKDTRKYSEFTYKRKNFRINVSGKYNVLNTLLIIEAATLLGLRTKKLQVGLSKYKPIEKRFEEIKKNDITIISDCYNANPESMRASLSNFIKIYPGKKIIVLGDMQELGEYSVQYHEEIGKFLDKYKDLHVITVGKLSKKISDTTKHPSVHFSSNIEVAKYISNMLEKGTHVYLKASRAMRFEEIIKGILR